ncbi:PHP domain-containing protein [Candidatus Woesearchaeota archaeon]|nr:PHP domain-containing protein [Candidatus Woesearchaeota archaeon]
MKKIKILNTEKEDYHVHSLIFSDGFNTIDEMVIFAGKLGMKKLVFADHSQAAMKAEGLPPKTFRTIVSDNRWQNVHNKVEVVFGVEADLLNEAGDICDEIDNKKSDFVILSYHKRVYTGDMSKLTQAFINAIEKHHDKINIIGHLYISILDGVDLDIVRIVELANKYNIPLELNAKYLFISSNTKRREEDVKKKTIDAIKLMLDHSDQIYVNSDAHTLYELKELRKLAFKFLKDNGYMN